MRCVSVCKWGHADDFFKGSVEGVLGGKTAIISNLRNTLFSVGDQQFLGLIDPVHGKQFTEIDGGQCVQGMGEVFGVITKLICCMFQSDIFGEMGGDVGNDLLIEDTFCCVLRHKIRAFQYLCADEIEQAADLQTVTAVLPIQCIQDRVKLLHSHGLRNQLPLSGSQGIERYKIIGKDSAENFTVSKFIPMYIVGRQPNQLPCNERKHLTVDCHKAAALFAVDQFTEFVKVCVHEPIIMASASEHIFAAVIFLLILNQNCNT